MKLIVARIVIGEIVKPYGILGQVVIRVFCQDVKDLTRYGNLYKKNGERIDIKVLRVIKPQSVIASVLGCCDRNAAELLRKTQLLIDRDQLPETQDPDEFYIHDLIGLKVKDIKTQEEYGQVVYVHSLEGGTFLEIQPAVNKKQDHPSIYTLPFSIDAVKNIDLLHHTIFIDITFLL